MATERDGYVTGMFAGFVAAAVLVHVWFAVLLAPLRDMYDDVSEVDGERIPALTHLVVHPAWLWGVPIAGAALCVALYVRRPRRVGPYAASALLLVTTLVATWVLSQTPARELANTIKLDDPKQVQLVPVGP